jgi:NTE family protein
MNGSNCPTVKRGRRRHGRVGVNCALALLLIALSVSVFALPCDRTGAKQEGRPRIGLVLGGGGARGAAHVGVLKVLEDMQVPIDCVVGNSMGAIVGGLYASGLSPDDIEREMVNMDWDDVLDDKPARPDQQFRRKRDDDNYLIKKYIGMEDGRIELPLGYIQGQKFDMELTRLTQDASGAETFDELPIPFRAVATDIETGKVVVLSKGNLARSIRASMAVPGAFDPVEIDGLLLVDGLVANNVPVDVARAIGADILIVVNVGTPLAKRGQIKSALDVLNQMSNILSDRNVEMQLATLKEHDILITPELGELSTSDFKRATDAIAVGFKAASTKRDVLAAVANPASNRKREVAARREALGELPVIEFVRIDNRSKLDDAVLTNPFEPLIGKQLDYAALRRSVEELYGWNIFESVRYEVVTEDARKGLLLHVTEKSWGPNYVQLGMNLATDFDGDSSWNIGVSVLKTALNRYAGELRLAGQIGDSPLAFAEFYQPLGRHLRYFISPQMASEGRDLRRFEDGDEIESYRAKRYGGRLAGGRVLGRWGEFRVGVSRFSGDAEKRFGNPPASDIDFEDADAFVRLTYDTLDDRNWPRQGVLAQWDWTESLESLGADANFTQTKMQVSTAHSWGRHTVLGGVRATYTADGIAPVSYLVRSGGFFNLSGFTQDQFSGQHEILLRAGYYQRLGNVEWLPAYAGFSLEYGNVYQDRDDISLAPEDALAAGSVFVGVDTILGPIYLSYGHAEQGNNGVYLFLGRLF